MNLGSGNTIQPIAINFSINATLINIDVLRIHAG